MSYIRPVIDAFKVQKAKKLSNTESTGKELLLFKNTIAKWKNNEIWITNAGWKTVTTKSRLQLLGVKLKQIKGIWYLNNKEWDGNWIQIDNTLKIKESIYDL